MAQLDKVLSKWFTAMFPKGKPVTGPMMVEKPEPRYGKMNVTVACSLII
jgi:hypothetical protein